MKKPTQFLTLSIICLLFFSLTSCQQECDCEKKAKMSDATTRAVDLDVNKSFRERLVSSVSSQVSTVKDVPRFKFTMEMLPEGIQPQDLDILTKDLSQNKSEALANVEATELVTSIFNALIAAENSENQLAVEFSMSDEPVDNGSFIFGIKSDDAQDLTLMMYDEEGFGVVANNKFQVQEGSNYKALNVANLEPGGYIFKLRNEQEGRELIRRVEIAE
ncbi:MULTISPECIES: hypothetical protein [unclassified Aureispira]|uniref:hypothetical protein n=1 Tax=unclassified Aureispira TaxID=2649989 RepID=UPI0012DD37B4|nr:MULTISPECIES: hypothetical protein [unclassified Aureispira]WMX15226.1 hypothetical protein QP953_02430 [Aureispira sp. CCB-E]